MRADLELSALCPYSQPLEVEQDQTLHLRVDVLIGVALEPHDIAHDLLVGLSVVPIRGIARGPEGFAQRPLHRGTAEPLGVEQRAVNVEKNESHDLVRKTPATIVAAPTP